MWPKHLGARQVVVTRELTKLHEQAIAGEAGPLAQTIGKQRGEITLLIAPPDAAAEMSESDIRRGVACGVGRAAGWKGRLKGGQGAGRQPPDLYDRALDLKNQLE